MRTRAVLQMRTSALFCAYNFGFFEIYDVSIRTRREGVESVRTKKGVNFSRFCAGDGDVFMDGPLKRLPKIIILTKHPHDRNASIYEQHRLLENIAHENKINKNICFGFVFI